MFERDGRSVIGVLVISFGSVAFIYPDGDRCVMDWKTDSHQFNRL